MLPWYQNSLMALDLETTGLDPLDDRIVQVAILEVAADGIISADSWDGIVDPGVEIPTGASDVHGISTEQARAEGVQPAEALQRIANLIDGAARAGTPLVIYNAPFDWPFVLAEAQRHDVTLLPEGIPVDIIDPLVLDKAMDRYRKGSRRLDFVAPLYGHELDNAHDARADALAAVTVARALGERYPDIGDASLEALQGMQTQWHAEAAESLAAYLGKPIDSGWPLPTTAGHLA